MITCLFPTSGTQTQTQRRPFYSGWLSGANQANRPVPALALKSQKWNFNWNGVFVLQNNYYFP